MTESGHKVKASRITWIARIIGLVAAGTFLSLIVVELIRGWYLSPETSINIAVIFFEFIAIAGIVISWWRQLLAGIFLIVASAGLSFNVILYAEPNYLIAWLIIGFPYLVSSMLFFVSWKHAKQIS